MKEFQNGRTVRSQVREMSAVNIKTGEREVIGYFSDSDSDKDWFLELLKEGGLYKSPRERVWKGPVVKRN